MRTDIQDQFRRLEMMASPTEPEYLNSLTDLDRAAIRDVLNEYVRLIHGDELHQLYMAASIAGQRASAMTYDLNLADLARRAHEDALAAILRQRGQQA